MRRTFAIVIVLAIAGLHVGCSAETDAQKADREFRRDAFNRLNARLSSFGSFGIGGDKVANVLHLGRAYCGVASFPGHSEPFVVTEHNVTLRADRRNFDEYFEMHCEG